MIGGVTMGFFKKSPAEKKVKELTGGILLSGSFMDRLSRAGLTSKDGYEIQNELKESIKRNEVEAEGVETRLAFLIRQRQEAKGQSKTGISIPRSQPKRRGHIDLNKKTGTYDGAPDTKEKLLAYIDNYDIDASLKAHLKEEVRKGNIKDIGSLLRTINSFKKGAKKAKSQGKIKEEDSKIVHVLTADKLESMAKDDKVKKLKYLLNQEHNLEKCPNCGADILKKDKFCYKCGFDVLKALIDKDFKEGNIGISFGSKQPVSVEKPKSTDDELSDLEEKYKSATEPEKQSKSTTDELSELEKLYNKKVSRKYAPKFKFAYVLYLNEINKNPSKSIKGNYYKTTYDTSLAKIKKQAKEDGFIGDGSPLLAAKSATVKDLKALLKEHDLMVSGKKDELIERLGENLSEDELKEAFPKKTIAITDEGLEFIENNRYVFYYDKASPVRNHISVEDYDSVFEEEKDLSDENIYRTLVDYLVKREDELASNGKWIEYRYNFIVLERVYKDMGDDHNLLDVDFKLFIAGINNFNDYTNSSEPAYGYIGKTYSNELIDLLHSLSLSIDELKDKFNQSYDELRYPDLKISKEESLVYLLKLFNGDDIDDLTEEIRSKYPDPNIGISY